MNIGINAWRLFGPRLGIGRYIEYLLKYWSPALQPNDHVTIFTHEPLSDELIALSDKFTNRVIRPRLTAALWENLFLGRYARELDVLFCPSYTVPMTYFGKSVVVIHGVDEVEREIHPWSYRYWQQRYRVSAHKATRIVTNAHCIKDRIVQNYKVPEYKVDVVWLGADEVFRPLVDPELMRATRERYVGSDRPYILFMGGLSRRRNVDMLFEAFRNVKSRADIPHCLLLLGPNRGNYPLEYLARNLGISDSVVHRDISFNQHRDAVPVYNAADLFVLPSSSEGFSLTLVEAMACGVPTITIRRAALQEIAGNHAYMLDEPSVPALADAIEVVLKDVQLRKDLSSRGVERARDFSWKRTAEQTLDILRRTVETEE